jgi:hydroxymethylglutaryl-CoA reductase
MFRAGGGFKTSSDDPVMIGQIQVLDLPDLYVAAGAIIAKRKMLLDAANEVGGSIVKRGGGARDIQVRPFTETPIGPMLVVHLLYDCRDAMGANAINTAVEHLAPHIENITGGRVNLRILSNLSDQRKAHAEGMIPAVELDTATSKGVDVARAVVEAGVFAQVDPYRAATHNKGIMNGIDALIIATGNDWRAIEAGAHAYAARSGTYTSLTNWWQDDEGNLHGSIELPMAVGIVGGATRVHPTAQIALKILGIESANQLGEVIASVGLAQNLAAMRALATEGIQRGHMSLHARQIAAAAGATGALINRIVQTMIEEDNIRLERAKALVNELRGK